MRLIFLPFLLFSVSSVSAQTALHVAIPGTKISLVPPAGFVAATRFSGFEQAETGATILAAELPTSAQQMVGGFTETALAGRGMKLLQKQPVDLHGTKATLFRVRQQANGIAYQKQILVFGTHAYTAMVTGTYPEKSAATAAAIRTALVSTYYNQQQPDGKRPVASFSVDVTGTPFKFAKNLAGSVLYTTDGKAPAEAADKALLVVSNSLGNKAVGDRQAFSIQRLKQLPQGATNNIRLMAPVTINGLSGYEITADGKGPKNENQLVYQTVLFTDAGEYYILVGLTDSLFKAHLDEFKKIARTFKRAS